MEQVSPVPCSEAPVPDNAVPNWR